MDLFEKVSAEPVEGGHVSLIEKEPLLLGNWRACSGDVGGLHMPRGTLGMDGDVTHHAVSFQGTTTRVKPLQFDFDFQIKVKNVFRPHKYTKFLF